MASAACIKTAGVPVEFSVATILLAILALLPIPVNITRPLEFKMNLTALTKEVSNKFVKLAIALLCKSIVFFAVANIELVFFKLKLVLAWERKNSNILCI